MRTGLAFAALATLATMALCSTSASADVEHTVGKGHTLEAIAHRYHVTVKSIVDANKGVDSRHLKVGDVLTIPKVDAPKKTTHGKDKDNNRDNEKEKNSSSKAKTAAHGGDAAHEGKLEHSNPVTFAAKPKTPGVIHIKRIASTEETDLKITDHSGKVAAATLKTFEKMMRSPAGASHPIEARLISLLGVVSNHFGSRRIEVVSGFRPYTPTQYTPHSNHNHGKAIDFRVIGVPNEAVRDFCRTLKNVGCGYYPNSTFVHMDVRENSAFWIDYSKPGEPPRYNAPNVEADEGTSDVHPASASPSANTAPPASAPAEEPAPGTPNESDPPPAMKPETN